MTTLKLQYDSEDDIDEAFRPLYTEKDGKFNFTAITGLKTQGDIDKLNVGIKKEREHTKTIKVKLDLWGELDPTETLAKLDTIPELEAAAKGKLNETEIEAAVERRLVLKMAPVVRENKDLKDENAGLLESNNGHVAVNRTRSIHDVIHKALTKGKVIPDAFEDALMMADRVFEIREDDDEIVTKANVGVTPGIDAESWLAEIQPRKSHWWPGSVGGGASGSKSGTSFGKNPFSGDNFSLTEQGQVIKEHGMKRAEQMAKAAGTTVGGPQPAAKTKD